MAHHCVFFLGENNFFFSIMKLLILGKVLLCVKASNTIILGWCRYKRKSDNSVYVIAA